MRSGSEFGQADSPIGWVRNTPQQPPWLRGSRNCLLWDGAKIRCKTVALIRDFCENQAAGIDAKRKLACSGSIHRHDPFETFRRHRATARKCRGAVLQRARRDDLPRLRVREQKTRDRCDCTVDE
jgi:hypothetical protein